MRALLLFLACVAQAPAQASCVHAGVEWIIGGPSSPDCDEAELRKPARPEQEAGALRANKVNPAQQQLRDQERLTILARELDQEQRLLPRTADAESAMRIRGNIDALKREIARVQPLAH